MTRRCDVDGCSRKHAARGMCPLHYYRFNRTGSVGSPGLLQAPDGMGSVNRQGYRMHKVSGRVVAAHVLVAEAAFGGPLPRRAEVHHVDGNALNNAPSNLVVCPDQRYHKLLHMRARALDACGNPSWRICSFCKRYDDPAVMTCAKDGNKYRHPECYRQYSRVYMARRRSDQKKESANGK